MDHSPTDRPAGLDRRLALLADELTGVRPARAGFDLTSQVPDIGAGPSREGSREAWWGEHTRVAEPRLPIAAGVGPAPREAWVPPAAVRRPLPGAAGAGPAPGRHAAPRTVPLVRVGAFGSLGGPQLAVVAVVVTLGLLVTGWWFVRGDAHPADDLRAAPAAGLVSPAAEPVAAISDTSAAPDTAATTTASGETSAGAASGLPGTVTVDVAGKVRHPGIAVLASGSRVADALEAAGGAKPGIDLTALNLARVLTDGEQLLVGIDPPTGVAAASSTLAPAPGSSGTTSATSSGTSSGPAPGTLVDLNMATATDLDALPEVGPVTAASILTWRDQHGGFTSVDELLEVDGIGDATLAKLAPYVTV